jgi:hypothetical protein
MSIACVSSPTRESRPPEAEFEKALDALLGKLSDGDGLAFLLQENNSPTRERLRGEIEKKFSKALWTVYEPVGAASTVEAHQSAFGQGLVARPDFSKADVILSLDCDFLGIDGDIAEARAYAARRKVEGGNQMNRLYVVENRYTVTGGMADHRLRLQASQIGTILLELAGILGDKTGDAALKAGRWWCTQGPGNKLERMAGALRGRSDRESRKKPRACRAAAIRRRPGARAIDQLSARRARQHTGRPSFAYASGSEYFRPREGARRQDDQDFGDRRRKSRLQCARPISPSPKR